MKPNIRFMIAGLKFAFFSDTATLFDFFLFKSVNPTGSLKIWKKQKWTKYTSQNQR